MTRARSEAAAAARIGAGLALRERAGLLELLRPCFARPEPWLQAGKYAAAVMSEVPERNGWSIARHAGDKTPDKTQRLLNHASWEHLAAMGVVRRFAIAGLEDAARRRERRRGGLVIGAIDETGQEKAGSATAGVKRQYMGCAGRVANGINTVHLSYVREGTGHALIGARQWIPREHIEDPVKSLLMGLPSDPGFRTKGQLAIDLSTDAAADRIGPDFYCGVYGNCTELRGHFEAGGQAYVLRVRSNFTLTLAASTRLTCAEAARSLLRHKRRWEVRSAGSGSKGERWYAWAWIATASPRHHLLIRRHLKSGELAFHYCYVPEGQLLIKTRLIRAAGLDEHQVRRWDSWYRWTTLAMLALAFLTIAAATEHSRGPSPDDQIPLTRNEIAALFSTLIIDPVKDTRHRLRWSAWRRRRQHRARTCHYQRQARQP